MQFQSMTISLLHMHQVHLPLPELDRQFWANFIKGMWNIINEVDKKLVRIKNINVWYLTSVSGFLGWHVALIWEDSRYFYCSSQINHMKDETFLWSFPKVIDLNSLLKSTLAGKGAFDISSWSFPNFIFSSLSLIR